MTRTRRSVGLYGALGCLGFILAGLGAILPELRIERDLPRTEAVLYPSAFALGLVVVGLVGPQVARRLGRLAIPVALVAVSGGAVILAFGSGRLDSGFGAVVFGLGGAGLVHLVPERLRALDGGDGTVPIGEANAVASVGSVLAPLLIGAALGHGLDWRIGFLAVPVISTVIVLGLLRPTRQPAPEGAENAQLEHTENTENAANREIAKGAPKAPREFFGWWLLLVLAVAVEFCMLFWATDFLRTVRALPSDLATGASAGFVLGMAVGRAGVGPIVRRTGSPMRLLRAAVGVTAVGFAIFWMMPVPAASVVGLLVTGLGIALMYPVILAQALASWPGQPVRAAARCALASGVAIGSAPLFLGALADAVSLRNAYLLVPILLAVLLGCVLRIRPTWPSHEPSRAGRG